MGRPSQFTQKTADSICELLADGQSLRSICSAKGMPNKATVFRWLAQNKDFSDQYERAREAQADALADEILDIVDGNGEPNDKRVKMDARKWLAGKLKPKKYGEKVEHSGPEGGPITITWLPTGS